MKINPKNLGGGALPLEAVEWIWNNLPEGSHILELGSGFGTRELAKRYKVTSIEHEGKWLDLVRGVNYIHAPLKDYQGGIKWYNLDGVQLPQDYDLLIIDGPVGKERISFVEFLSLFRSDVPWLIDDTQRHLDKAMAITIIGLTKRPYKEIKGEEKNTMIILP